MDSYNKISSELRNYFGSIQFIRSLMPFDAILIIGSLAVMLFFYFVNLPNILFLPTIEGIIVSATYYIFIFGLILAFANMNNQYLYMGLFGYAIYRIVTVIYSMLYNIFANHYFYFPLQSLVDIAIFAGLGYLVYRRSLVTN